MAKTITIDDDGNIVGYKPLLEWCAETGVGLTTIKRYIYGDPERHIDPDPSIPVLTIKMGGSNTYARFIKADYRYDKKPAGKPRRKEIAELPKEFEEMICDIYPPEDHDIIRQAILTIINVKVKEET